MLPSKAGARPRLNCKYPSNRLNHIIFAGIDHKKKAHSAYLSRKMCIFTAQLKHVQNTGGALKFSGIIHSYDFMNYNQAIESICFKFGHALTEFDVFRWLRNFDENEWAMALNVLDKVIYYSSDNIDEMLEYYIQKIIEEHPKERIYILPSGNVGKSGHVMAYHAKKVIEKLTLSEKTLSLLNLKCIGEIKNNAVIALLDDFSGTGESIKKFYENNVKAVVNGKHITICALTIAYMEKSAEYLYNECGITIYGDLNKPAFIRRGSVFGYEKSMIQVRDFCFKKGEMLYPNWRNEDLKPLGYKNSQALVCFEHTTPNNTLPILWSEMEIPGTNKKWNAIFPRFASSRIDRGRRLRISSGFWISAMQKMKMPNIDWSLHHTTESLRLISVVAQKYHHRSDLYIAQVLGINMHDLEGIVRIGKEKGLFNEDGGITQEAITIYKEIRKRDRILERDIPKQISKQNINSVYVPRSFRGIT